MQQHWDRHQRLTGVDILGSAHCMSSQHPTTLLPPYDPCAVQERRTSLPGNIFCETRFGGDLSNMASCDTTHSIGWWEAGEGLCPCLNTPKCKHKMCLVLSMKSYQVELSRFFVLFNCSLIRYSFTDIIMYNIQLSLHIVPMNLRSLALFWK